MNHNNHQSGKIRRIIGRIAPGLESFSRYDRGWLRADLGAGLSVAAIALPVGIAYSELADQGIVLAYARVKLSLERHFEADWVSKRRQRYGKYVYHTLKAAVHAFNHRADREAQRQPATGLKPADESEL